MRLTRWFRQERARVKSGGSGTITLSHRVLGGAVLGFVLLTSIGSVALCEESRCSCLGPQELEYALEASDAVFIGTVEGFAEILEALPLTPDVDQEPVVAPRRLVRFRSLGSWKGGAGDVIEVRIGLSTADCGFPFEVGETYLVFAAAEGSRLTTSSCSRTALIEDAVQDLLALGPPPIEPRT